MKRISTLFCTALTAVLMLTGCDPENYQHPEVLFGTWVQTETPKAGALILTFDDDYMYVDNADSDDKPFQNSDVWYYWMDADSTLTIEYEYYDSDGYYQTSSRMLELSFGEDFQYLTLVYDPFLGKRREYHFFKRN